MPDAKDVKFSFKVMINNEETKVLYAEADNDFVDVLLSFLTLPLAKIVRVLEKHYGEAPAIGSLTTLYDSMDVKILSSSTEAGFSLYLHPRSAYEEECKKLKLSLNFTDMFCEFSSGSGEPKDGVFVSSKASFLISDDLRVEPNGEGTIMQTLNYLGLTILDMDGAKTMNVTFGLNEIIGLLKGSFLSPTPLSDLILNSRQTGSVAATKHRHEVLLHQLAEEGTKETMIMKLMVQKSTNKLLFAQVHDEFIDFLVSILAIPLGRVEWLLCSNTGLQNIDNLHRSVSVIDEFYLKTTTKSLLMNPELHRIYLPRLTKKFSLFPASATYVVSPGMFTVTDDLSIRPLVLTSTLSIVNKMEVPVSDVEEVQLHFGLEEALRILKASLTSTTVLSDALLNPLLKKQQK